MDDESEEEALFSDLQRGNDNALSPLLAVVHRSFCLGHYEKSISLLFKIAACTLKHSNNERAIVLQTVALASMLAQRHDLTRAAQVLKIAAQYANEWPERDEVIDLACKLVDVALEKKDFRSAQDTLRVVGICSPIRSRPELHARVVALAVRIKNQEAYHNAAR